MLSKQACSVLKVPIFNHSFKNISKNRFKLQPFVKTSHSICNVIKCSNIVKSNKSTHHIYSVRNFKREIRKIPEELDGVQHGFSRLFKPLCFTVLIGTASFTGAIIWQYENMRNDAKLKRSYGGKISSRDSFYGKAGEFRHKINGWWNSLVPAQKLAAGIIGLNIGIFLLWRVPSLSPFMGKFFTSNPVSTAVAWPMLFSAFSHHGAFHLLANMYVLWSFAPAVNQLLGREQFSAVYLSGAMVAAFTSCAYKLARRSWIPSLGASGAIMAIIGAVCTAVPQTQLSIVFVNQIIPHSFSADSAIKGILLFDIMGVLLGWRFFDHAAHLGGMLFGIWYVKYGHKMIWQKREPLMRFWHEIRGKP